MILSVGAGFVPSAELSRHWDGDRWKWRLHHRQWGGPYQSAVQYRDYTTESNALDAFRRVYGEATSGGT